MPLTRLEFLLLQELASHSGRPIPRATLLAKVWGFEFDPGSNVVDVCVRRLRSKLGFELIKTVRGQGYQLTARLAPVAPQPPEQTTNAGVPANQLHRSEAATTP